MLSFVHRAPRLFITALVFVGALSGSAVLAQTTSLPNANTPGFNATNSAPCPDGVGTCTTIPNPLQSRGTNIFAQVGGFIQFVLLIMGSLTLMMVVWGGFMWLTAAGNSDQIAQGSKTMMWAVIGVLVILASYILLGTYLDYLTGAK